MSRLKKVSKINTCVTLITFIHMSQFWFICQFTSIIHFIYLSQNYIIYSCINSILFVQFFCYYLFVKCVLLFRYMINECRWFYLGNFNFGIEYPLEPLVRPHLMFYNLCDHKNTLHSHMRGLDFNSSFEKVLGNFVWTHRWTHHPWERDLLQHLYAMMPCVHDKDTF